MIHIVMFCLTQALVVIKSQQQQKFHFIFTVKIVWFWYFMRAESRAGRRGLPHLLLRYRTSFNSLFACCHPVMKNSRLVDMSFDIARRLSSSFPFPLAGFGHTGNIHALWRHARPPASRARENLVLVTFSQAAVFIFARSRRRRYLGIIR